MHNEIKPLKRDKSLIPLSREHHFGLLFCWKLRQGLKNNTELEVLRAYVHYFWTHILKAHCEEEEWVLKRLLPKNDTMRMRIEEEHRLLQAIIQLITEGSGLNKDLIQVLEKDLVDHIRWEERELFPYLQLAAQADELELTGKLLEQKHAPSADNFQPEFWTAGAKAA